MRNFLLACLSVCFIAFAAAAQTPAVNQADLLRQFLKLPAPPPSDEKSAQIAKINQLPRPTEFYEPARVPPDDAPIEDLLEFWAAQGRPLMTGQPRQTIKPSEKVVERILEFCEENPAMLMPLLGILPTDEKTVEIVKRIYDKTPADGQNVYGAHFAKNWLTYNSTYFIDELIEQAEKVKDKDRYVTNQTELLALARVDWNRAQPILERLAGDSAQPVSQTLARWAYYARAIKTENEQDITKYRRLLQETVENRDLSAGNRDLAMDALVMEKEWEGREDWYFSLLSDETLYTLESYTGLTTILRFSPAEKMIPAMTKLIDNKNPAIRKAAIRNLVNYVKEGKIEAVRALLPWLSNPGWMSEIPDGRAALITALGKVDLPESVPVLITILLNEEPFRPTVAEALIRYKDPRSVPALKTVLAEEKIPYRRQIYIRALDESGGIGDEEKASALEIYAELVSTPEGAIKFQRELYGGDAEDGEKPAAVMPVALSIGNYVSQQTEPPDALVLRVLERMKLLRKTKPLVAASLAQIMNKWRGRVVYLERLRQIRTGEADLETILTAIAQRRDIRAKIESEIFAMRAGSGSGRGIAACLAEDEADLQSVLRQTDALAKIAMLGCARLIRARLPVPEVGALLKSADKNLAIAAERYLETEDSVEARTLVLASHPNEAVILGARHAFFPDPKDVFYSESLNQIFQSVSGRGFYAQSYSMMDKNETALREEIKSNPDLLAIYGIFANRMTGQMIIRVFQDKIVFTFNEDAARYRERTLTAKEYEDFYRLVLDEKIDSLSPSMGYCEGCEPTEFVMFGKSGGRRVFFTNATTEDSPVKKLFERFASFNDANLKLHYRLAEKIKGLEVLLANDQFPARAVWKNGADFRVLVEDKEKEAEIEKNLTEQFELEDKAETEDGENNRYEQKFESQEKRRAEKKYAHYFWRRAENGALGEILPQPAEMPYLFDDTQFPETPGFDNEPRAWQVRAGNFEIKVSHEESGLYRVSRSQQPAMFKEGEYDFPIVTPDGVWVVASKAAETWQEPKSLVRINLQSGKEFPVGVLPADTLRPLTFVAAHNKILVNRARGNQYYGYRPDVDAEDDEEQTETPAVRRAPFPGRNDKNPSPQTPEFYLLDAATGSIQIVKGEFRPLEDLTYRPLQPAGGGAPDEFWAAVYDKKAKETAVGRYNTKTFTFVPVTRLPEIKLGSMDIWVDEKESKVYFVYEGHVLAAPLQNQQK